MKKPATNNDTFTMYCPKCGRKYTVSVHNPDPKCKRDDVGLDFEPVKKEQGKCNQSK